MTSRPGPKRLTMPSFLSTASKDDLPLMRKYPVRDSPYHSLHTDTWARLPLRYRTENTICLPLCIC